jgi:hypothetical protein
VPGAVKELVEARLRRPRRARVARLREQRRQPRRVEGSGPSETRKRTCASARGRTAPSRRRARDRRTAPGCASEPINASVGARTIAQPRRSAQHAVHVREHGEQRGGTPRRVHPRLLAVVGEVRRERDEHEPRRRRSAESKRLRPAA